MESFSYFDSSPGVIAEKIDRTNRIHFDRETEQEIDLRRIDFVITEKNLNENILHRNKS